MFSFESLSVYKEARAIVVDVYGLINRFPQYERFALSQQLARAVVSVASNIAEGNGRISVKEKIHFVEISYGSLLEVFCQLQIATDLGYIEEIEVEQLRPRIEQLASMLSALRRTFKLC